MTRDASAGEAAVPKRDQTGDANPTFREDLGEIIERLRNEHEEDSGQVPDSA